MKHANYEIIADTPELLRIRDLGQWDEFPTVTNDAEHVVVTLAERLGPRRLEYIDSDGEFAVLLVRDGCFMGFCFALPSPK